MYFGTGEVRSDAEHRNQIKIEVMEVVSTLIFVLVISTRNKPHKDPDPPAGGLDDGYTFIGLSIKTG
jgi:hypothetical protein